MFDKIYEKIEERIQRNSPGVQSKEKRLAKDSTPHFPGFILSRFQILESLSFAAKDNFCLFSKLHAQLYACLSSYTTNDWQVYHGFVYLVNFAKFLPGTNFVGGAFEDLSASAKICQVATIHPHL